MILNESKNNTIHKFKCTKCKHVFDYNYGELPKDCNAATWCPKCASLARKMNESTVDLKSIKKGDWVVATIYGNLVPAKMESSKISGPTFRAWSHGEHLAEYSRSTIKYHAKSEDDAIDWIKKNK